MKTFFLSSLWRYIYRIPTSHIQYDIPWIRLYSFYTIPFTQFLLVLRYFLWMPLGTHTTGPLQPNSYAYCSNFKRYVSVCSWNFVTCCILSYVTWHTIYSLRTSFRKPEFYLILPKPDSILCPWPQGSI